MPSHGAEKIYGTGITEEQIEKIIKEFQSQLPNK